MRAKRKAEKAGPRSTAPPYVLKVPRSTSSVPCERSLPIQFFIYKASGVTCIEPRRRSMESGPQGLCRTKVVSKYFGYGWTTPSLPTIEIDNAPRTSTQNQANHARKSFNKLLEEKCGWLIRGIMLGRHSHPQSRKTGWSVKFGTGNHQRKNRVLSLREGK